MCSTCAVRVHTIWYGMIVVQYGAAHVQCAYTPECLLIRALLLSEPTLVHTVVDAVVHPPEHNDTHTRTHIGNVMSTRHSTDASRVDEHGMRVCLSVHVFPCVYVYVCVSYTHSFTVSIS